MSEETTKRSHPHRLYRTGSKVLLVLLACIMALTAICGVLVLLAGGEMGLLTDSRTDFRHALYDTFVWGHADSTYDCYSALHGLGELDEQSISDFAARMENNAPTDLYLQLRLVHSEGEILLFDNLPDDMPVDWTVTHSLAVTYYGEDVEYAYREMVDLPYTEPTYIRTYEMTLTVPEQKTPGSLYDTIYTVSDVLHRLRWGILLLTVISAMLVIATFALLIWVAGKQPDGTVRLNTIDRMPYDLFLGIYFLFVLLQVGGLVELSYSNWEGGTIALCIVCVLLDLPLLILLFTGTATRCKCGTILKNTLVWRLLRLAWWLLRQFWRVVICGGARGFAHLLRVVPLIWQGIVGIALLSIISLIVIMNVADDLFPFWLIGNLMLIPLGVYALISFYRLRQGAQHLAQGDLSYHVDEKPLIGAFRNHGKDLNSIRHGINRAVEERMRSERFRTELITNVSHDIKTPLTSIINYIDLLGKELPMETRTEATAQYLEAIERQSLRLKKLIVDLTEASKASTGALPVHPAPCQVGVLLSQALAEYSDRLQAAGLEPIVRLPEREPTVMLDGALIWRVFDNLLSNAVKYSLCGTRLYIDVDEAEDAAKERQIRIVFRNISGQPLRVTPGELTERFVRGDASRHTEGSGLGLSIAHSLVSLHGGQLHLEVDGDLFKATVLLPLSGMSEQ